MSTFILDILALVFGCISIVITIAIEFPQLVSIFKTKNTSGTSLMTYILFIMSSFLWVSWAIVNYVANVSYITPDTINMFLHVAALVPAIISNLINVMLVGCILFLKIKHVRNSKKLHINEIQYSKILFDKQKGFSWIKKYYPLIIIAGIVLLACIAVILVLYFVGLPQQISKEEYKQFALIVFILNIAAAIFFESISWPQFIKCMKTKDTSGISLGWAIFLPLSCVICFTYDLLLGLSTGWWNVLASLICSGMLINIAVLVLKIRNLHKAKKLGISEWHYTNKYLSKKK